MNKKSKEEALDMLRTFNHISAVDLEEIMEWLEDNSRLSGTGEAFRADFWELFIKD